tara:strand:+ start:434 stop:616 length:183 start_codon:yes stop_codon:yes gene_type:complete
MKNLILKNGQKTIEFGGIVHNGEIEVEIDDDAADLFAYTWITKPNLIALNKHIEGLLKEM